MISRRNLLWLLLAGGLSRSQGFAYAEDGSGHGGDDDGDEDDQNRALDAVRNNHAASLREILAIVRKQYEGEIVHVSLRGSGPTLIYYIKLLDSGDRLIEVQIDALSRQIVHVEGT